MAENVIYPAYFDADLSRSEGRRVPQDLAVEEPTAPEVAAAVEQIGYDVTVDADAAYSRQPWDERGRVLVSDADDSSKHDLVQAAAAYLAAMRE